MGESVGDDSVGANAPLRRRLTRMGRGHDWTKTLPWEVTRKALKGPCLAS